ncbi:MAG: flavodoxin family protein [Coriobacteriia bacterium]
MKALVVYESLWGNTKAVAEAIAGGIGDGARAVSTADASREALEGVDLLVAGAPVLAFSLPSERIREDQRTRAEKTPDLSHPSMRSWLRGLPKGKGRAAAFDTRIWWTPRGSKRAILRGLAAAGYLPAATESFIVTGTYGPLREGELTKAREWGRRLAEKTSARREAEPPAL